jgi:hypothetical protein
MTDTPLSPEQVAALKQKAEAASKGPWRREGTSHDDGAVEVRADTAQIAVLGGFSVESCQDDMNAAHIAANSPDVTIRLIDDLEDARRERDEANRLMAEAIAELEILRQRHRHRVADLTQQVTRLRDERDIWKAAATPSDGPQETQDGVRLLINAYGRRCYDAGRLSALTSPPEEREP